MTGFIRGLFSRKDSDQPEEPQGAFFLDDDSAKSMGDVEYMRSVKATRRTFPISVDTPDHIEIIQSVSAMDKSVNDSRKGYTAPQAQPQANFSSNQATSFASAPASSYSNSSNQASSFSNSTPASGFASNQATSFSSAASSFSSSNQAKAPEPTVEPTVESSTRRKSDSGMDMFRSMAKDIRK
jgi:hypothetical protein